MGAWTFMDRRIEKVLRTLDIKAKRPDYVGREDAASPATGLARIHAAAAGSPGAFGPRPVTRRRQDAINGRHDMTDILVPTLGESVSSATVARWLKKAGEAVAADEPLVELETDKVTVEVNAPSAGVLEAIAAAEGAEVGPAPCSGRSPPVAPPPRRRPPPCRMSRRRAP